MKKHKQSILYQKTVQCVCVCVFTLSWEVWQRRCRAVGSQSTAIYAFPTQALSSVHSIVQPRQNLKKRTQVDYLLDKNTNSGSLKTCTSLQCLNLILGSIVDLILWKISRSVFCLFDIRLIYITVTCINTWCSIMCLTCTRDTRHTSCHPCQRPVK